MSRKLKIILSSTALVFGCLIVFISLINANPISSEGLNCNNKKTFYLSENILPDNIIYPLFRITDRLKLVTAQENDQIFLRIEYGLKRLETGQQLLEQEKKQLAFITFSKGHHYLLQATDQYLKKQEKQELIAKRLEDALLYQRTIFFNIKDNFSDAHRARIDKIIQENEIYLKKINPHCQIEKNLVISN